MRKKQIFILCMALWPLFVQSAGQETSEKKIEILQVLNEQIELSLDWILKNRYASDHPAPNLPGAVINTRLRHKQGKLWITQRDVGSPFGVRFLASYYDYTFGERTSK